MIRAFHAHKLIGEWPNTHIWQAPEDGSLIVFEILGPNQAKEIKRFEPGQWHSIGVDQVCGSADDGANCPICQPQRLGQPKEKQG